MEHALSFLGLVLIIPLTFVVWRFGTHVHKHESKYYVVVGLFAFIVGVYAIVLQAISLDFKAEHPVWYAVLYQGHLTFPFFILVMFAGALKPKSKPKITLMKVRRELAIIGFLFLIPHAIYLVWLALSNLNPTGTLSFLIMLPLFITSFTQIRKKMHPTAWRKLHKWAYPAYALIYLHLASITLVFNILWFQAGDIDALGYALGYVRFALYTVIFGVYTILKLTHRKTKTVPVKTKKTA